MKVEFNRHSLEPQDIEKAVEVLNSLFLTTGSVTEEFEKKFSNYTGLPWVVGLTSCTAALHLSLVALGIGPGDEVITTPMTFVATATAVLHSGAKPVFVDVEPRTGLIDPAKIEEAVTPRTKAILPVHLYGTLADMKAISKIAQRHHLRVIEDCAHAIEAERDGVRPGQLADAACFSFYATKNLTSGEGGAVGTRDPGIADRVRRLRLHGMTSDAMGRYGSRYKHWDVEEAGWKYNMDNIHAALLVRQIERIDRNWERRAALAERYRQGLRGVASVQVPEIRGKGAHHLETIWVDPGIRDEMLHGLQERGVGVAVNYRALHTLEFFRKTFDYKESDYPAAFQIGNRTLSLPLYPKLEEPEVDHVVECVRETLAQIQ